MANGKEEKIDLDKIFCGASKRFKIDKLYLKAVATVESNLNPKAYRFEEKFWEKYLKDNPDWNQHDPKIVSASHGICQLMATTAWALGLHTQPDEKLMMDLQNPVINIELCAKLIRQNLDKLDKEKLKLKFSWLDMFSVSLSRYNGGSYNNPDSEGKLRNQSYVDKVTKVYFDLKEKEANCPDE